MTDSDNLKLRLQEIEEAIEDAMWSCVQNEDYDTALQVYQGAREDLESLDRLSEDLDKERKRVLSYCILRQNDALASLDRSEGAIERAEESLKLAEESEDTVQILRSKLAVGVALLNTGNLPESEEYFTEIILQTRDETENEDIIQVYGWTLIVRVNILLGKSLYNQAKELAMHALGVLSGIGNYAGLRTSCSLLSHIYFAEGDLDNGELYKHRAEDYARLAKKHRQ